MASRLATFSVKPWQKGLNTSLDASLIEPDELQAANNCIFSMSGSRKSRGGLGLWDYIATGVSRISSGTTRTLVVSVNAGFTFSIGDQVSVRHNSSLNSDYDHKKVTLTAVDTVTYSPNVAIEYTVTGSLAEALTADADFRVGRWESESIIAIKDYWYYQSGNKLQKVIAVTSEGNFYSFDEAGSKSIIALDGAISLTTPIESASMAVLADKLVIALSGSANTPLIYTGTGDIEALKNYSFALVDVTATNPPPNLIKLRNHQSRIYGLDKENPDRIHYCDVQEPERWNGEGDSGALEVASGDGDKSGFSAIFPSFKGRLGVAKGDQLYQIVGEAPLQAIEKISDGIGCEAHDSCVAVDQDDVLFVSKRGVHSFSATDQYGDFAGTFLSANIQPDFNALSLDQYKLFEGAYVPSVNSVAFSVTSSGSSAHDQIFLYNVIGKQWYKWNSLESEFLITSTATYSMNNVNTLLLGLSGGRVLAYDQDNQYDFVDSPIQFEVKSGIIYVDNDPTKIKAYKRLGVLFKVTESMTTFDVCVKIDNYEQQCTRISRQSEADLLGVNFILGSSALGFGDVLLPESMNLDGYGFGAVITISSETPVEIYGFMLDFEGAGDQQETIRDP
jgi:hypothetical protein